MVLAPHFYDNSFTFLEPFKRKADKKRELASIRYLVLVMTRIVWVDCSKSFSISQDVYKNSKRTLIWTGQIELLFLATVHKLGEDATPSTILREMNVQGLTRGQVSSHLQKYRVKLKKRESTKKLSLDFVINQ